MADDASPSPDGAAYALKLISDAAFAAMSTLTTSNLPPSPPTSAKDSTSPHTPLRHSSESPEPVLPSKRPQQSAGYGMHDLVEQALICIEHQERKPKSAKRKRQAVTEIEVARQIRLNHPHVDMFLGRNW